MILSFASMVMLSAHVRSEIRLGGLDNKTLIPLHDLVVDEARDQGNYLGVHGHFYVGGTESDWGSPKPVFWVSRESYGSFKPEAADWTHPVTSSPSKPYFSTGSPDEGYRVEFDITVPKGGPKPPYPNTKMMLAVTLEGEATDPYDPSSVYKEISLVANDFNTKQITGQVGFSDTVVPITLYRPIADFGPTRIFTLRDSAGFGGNEKTYYKEAGSANPDLGPEWTYTPNTTVDESNSPIKRHQVTLKNVSAPAFYMVVSHGRTRVPGVSYTHEWSAVIRPPR